MAEGLSPLIHWAAMAKADHERRLDPRASVADKISVEYVMPGPRVRDLSVSGIYLFDSRPLQRGQSVELRLKLGQNGAIQVRGMVRRVDPGVGMAIEFIGIDHHDRRKIRDFLAACGAQARPTDEEEI